MTTCILKQKDCNKMQMIVWIRLSGTEKCDPEAKKQIGDFGHD